MALVRLPTTLRPLTGGAGVLRAEGADLAAVVAELAARHPGLGERLLDEHGELYRFVNVFVGDTECRRLAGLATPVDPETEVTVVPAVAGGAVSG